MASEQKHSFRVRSHCDDANYKVYFRNSDDATPEAVLAQYRAKAQPEANVQLRLERYDPEDEEWDVCTAEKPKADKTQLRARLAAAQQPLPFGSAGVWMFQSVFNDAKPSS